MPQLNNDALMSKKNLGRWVLNSSHKYSIIFILTFGIPLFLTFLGGMSSAFGISWLSFMLGASVGSFFGFIFSVPRIVANSTQEKSEILEQNSKMEIHLSGKRLLQTNSNLEQISDWLTTLIVGVALVNVRGITDFFNSFHDFLRVSISSQNVSLEGPLRLAPAAGTLLLVIGFVFGFLAMYLATRIKLASLLHEVEGIINKPLNNYAAEHLIDAAKSLPATAGLENLLNSGVIYPEEAVQVMNRLLYEERGYLKAINISKILSATRANLLPSFWFYLAAAYGQMYSQLLSENASDEKISFAKMSALSAARRAATIDSRYKKELLRISNESGEDNDLKDLREDPDFIAIIGLN